MVRLVLLVFSLSYAGLRAILAERPRLRSGHVSMSSLLALGLGLGVVSYCWRGFVPDGTYWPVVGVLTPSYLPQYVLCFAVGCLAARRSWLVSIPRHVVVVGALLAVLSFGTYLAVLGLDGRASGGLSAVALAAASLLSVAATFAITTVLALSERFVGGTGPLRKWLSDNAFAVYVVHAPVLALLGLALAAWAMPAAVKALGLFVLGAGVSWLVASAIRQIPGSRTVL